MTTMPPEEPLPETDETDEDQVDEVSLDPERDADGVTEDRLTGVAVYDNLERRYVSGVFRGRNAKRDAKADDRVKDDPERYSVRRV